MQQINVFAKQLIDYSGAKSEVVPIGGSNEMNELSTSIFTIEIDRKPVYAIRSRKHSDAEAVLADENMRHQLSLLRSGGKPLCDGFSIFRIRLARADERALYYVKAPALLLGSGELAVLLIELDDPA